MSNLGFQVPILLSNTGFLGKQGNPYPPNPTLRAMLLYFEGFTGPLAWPKGPLGVPWPLLWRFSGPNAWSEGRRGVRGVSGAVFEKHRLLSLGLLAWPRGPLGVPWPPPWCFLGPVAGSGGSLGCPGGSGVGSGGP